MADFEKIPELEENVKIISQLGDNPNADNGLTPEELKAKFDAAAVILKDHLNLVVQRINDLLGTGGSFFNGGTMLGVLNMNGFGLTNLPAPTAENDAVSKAYADAIKLIAEAAKDTAGGKVSKTKATIALAADGWSDNIQTVTVAGVTADNDVFVSAAPASYVAYAESMIRCTAQGANSLAFTCEEIPASAVSVNVIIFT